ncbi:MAG: hypothetical protein MI924_23765 [Chloroflexales bacterium]|nr:hypothetical protein [Chloroflexales bacterium]
MSETTPDVATILEELRAGVRARRQALGGGADTPSSALERQLQRCAEQLEITRVVSAHWPLEGRTFYQRAWAMVHKVVRRYLRWYINPIVEQQNAFNEVTARALRLLIEAHSELRTEVEQLQREQDTRDDPEPQSGDGVHAAPSLPSKSIDERAAAPADSIERETHLLTQRLAERQTVSAHWAIRNIAPIGLSKRMIRQYLRWYINPIVEQQNAFNAAVAAITPSVASTTAETKDRLRSFADRARP